MINACRGRHLAGRGELAGEEAAEPIRGLDHRAVTGDVLHRRQRVHLLRARDARHLVHRDHGELASGEVLDERRALRREQEADQRRALAHRVRLAAAAVAVRMAFGQIAHRRRANLEDDVRFPRVVAIDDRRARGLVHRVGVAGELAGAAFDRHLPTRLHPRRDTGRRCGDAATSPARVCPDDMPNFMSREPCQTGSLITTYEGRERCEVEAVGRGLRIGVRHRLLERVSGSAAGECLIELVGL